MTFRKGGGRGATRKGRWPRRGWKSSPYLLDTHTVVLMDEVGGLGFPKSQEVFVKKEGRRDRIKKLGNRAKVFFDK